MNVQFYPGSPAQMRLTAKFMLDLADLSEKEGPHGSYLMGASGSGLAQGAGADIRSPEPAREDQTEGADETSADASDEPRVYGTASEGRARRTKEEMAEDKEIEELADKLGVKKIPTDVAASEVLDALRQKDDETEEEPAAPAATRDDLLAAMKRYVDAIGPDEAMGNLPDILGVKKQSDLPDDPAVFAEKIAALDAATEEAA